MEMLFKLSLMFAKLCVFAFGGGYVMIPSLIKASEENHWATAAELTDVIAIAGMSPGPVAVNAAVGYGYKVAGLPGSIAAFFGDCHTLRSHRDYCRNVFFSRFMHTLK